MSTPLSAPMAADPARADVWRRSLPALALLLAAIGAVYYDSFRAMVLIWERSDTFAHAFVVPPIALWLMWRQREQLALHVPRPSAWLLVPLALTSVAWLLGQLVAVNSVTQLSITAMLILAVPAVLGLRVALVILFPLMYLFFAVPIGEFMIPPLMRSTADFTVLALRLSGVPVYREGLQFIIPSGSWSVVEACSGVRYLMASFMVGSLFAYLNYRSWRRRLLFGMVSLMVPIVANWLRAYMIVMLGHVSGNKLAVGADHLIYGWVFFGIVITVVFMIGARWAEAPAEPSPPRVATNAMSPVAWRPWAIAAAGALVVALPQLALQRIDASESTAAPRLQLPATLAGAWRSDVNVEALWTPAFRKPSTQTVARYVAGGDQRVGVYLAYYRRQAEGSKLVSSENVLVTSKDAEWNVVDSHSRELKLPDHRHLTVRESRLLGAVQPGVGDRREMLVWQLYWVNGTLTSQDHWAKAAGAWHRLLGQGDESAAIVLYALNVPAARAVPALESFVGENLSMIEAGLKATRDAR